MLRYEELLALLIFFAAKDEGVCKWGKCWDSYGLVNKPLFEGDPGGCVDKVAKLISKEKKKNSQQQGRLQDDSKEFARKLYLVNRIECMMALYVLKYERAASLPDKSQDFAAMGKVDFIDSSILSQMESFVGSPDL